MRERLFYSNINEPKTLLPILDPQIETTIVGDIPFSGERAELALNKLQRDWILARDGYRCQATVRHRCNISEGIEVDHLLPQRYCHEIGIMPDFPENLLSKCKQSHNIKHPDRIEALKKYHLYKEKGSSSFQEMFEERNKKVSHRQIYWNDENDRTDAARAIQLTQKAYRAGYVWPTKKGDEL